jgi:hypothetical protein
MSKQFQYSPCCGSDSDFIFTPNNLQFGDRYVCLKCKKLFVPVLKEITENNFEHETGFSQGRYDTIIWHAQIQKAKQSITVQNLIDLGLIPKAPENLI